MTLTIKEDITTLNSDRGSLIEIENREITLKNIIEIKIRKEVEEYNNKIINGENRVEITDVEKKLNSIKKTKNKKLIDIESQIETGMKAFENGEYFVLVDDRQIEDLDSIVEVKENTDINFIRLTPLIGG